MSTLCCGACWVLLLVVTPSSPVLQLGNAAGQILLLSMSLCVLRPTDCVTDYYAAESGVFQPCCSATVTQLSAATHTHTHTTQDHHSHTAGLRISTNPLSSHPWQLHAPAAFQQHPPGRRHCITLLHTSSLLCTALQEAQGRNVKP